LSESVLAAGDRVDAELTQTRVDLGGGVDRGEDGIDRSVAGERADQLLAAGPADADGRARGPPGRGLDVEPLQRVAGDLLAQLVGDQRLEVQRGHLLLLVRDLLEALEGGVE